MEPILNGAPGFILLAFVVALAGYLRQVSVNAQDRIDQIESEKHPQTWPKGAAHTEARLNLLRNTKENIERVARPLFILIVFVSFRAVLYALTRTTLSDSTNQCVRLVSNLWSAEWLKIIDLVITLFLLTLVSAMWIMHERGKTKEKEVTRLRLKQAEALNGK